MAGPSGSGKNAIIREIRSRYPNCATLTSATTRVPRAGEVEGADYYFMDVDQFDAETAAGHIAGTRFTPLFGGVHYGIYLPDLQKKLAASKVVFAIVDITGARYLKQKYGATTIFVMPESIQQFRSRLRARNPEWSDAEYEMRMKITEEEIHIHAPQYDYRVVNADGALHETVQQVIEILRKEGYNLA